MPGSTTTVLAASRSCASHGGAMRNAPTVCVDSKAFQASDQSVSEACPIVTTAPRSASRTALATLSTSVSGGKCVTSAVPSSCTPWAPAAKSAASAASRSSPGTTRIATQVTIGSLADADHRQESTLGAECFLHPCPESLLARLRRLLRLGQLAKQR